MSREAKEARATIRRLLKWLAVSVAVAAAVSLVLSTAIRNAASTTPAAPALANALANERPAALSERVSDKPRTPAIEGNPESLAIRGSSDPHFKVPDAFEAYSGDFTGGEPIPPAMLKTIEHAKGLLFDEEKTK